MWGGYFLLSASLGYVCAPRCEVGTKSISAKKSREETRAKLRFVNGDRSELWMFVWGLDLGGNLIIAWTGETFFFNTKVFYVLTKMC